MTTMIPRIAEIALPMICHMASERMREEDMETEIVKDG